MSTQLAGPAVCSLVGSWLGLVDMYRPDLGVTNATLEITLVELIRTGSNPIDSEQDSQPLNIYRVLTGYDEFFNSYF